jgi:hypothetical protein
MLYLACRELGKEGTMWKIAKIGMMVPVGLLPILGCTPDQATEEAGGPAAGNELLARSVMAALPPVGTVPADLPMPDSDGAQGIVKYCTTCHELPHPTTHSKTDWPVVMRRMWLRIERVADDFPVPVPNAAERFTMTQYMLDNALKVSMGDLPDYLGREYFILTCDRCHERPDPRQHSVQDWPAVVSRMRQHMVDLLGDSPIQAEMRDITAYLQRVSQ